MFGKDRQLRQREDDFGALPVVAETWDGELNDIKGFHVKPEHVRTALDKAQSGPVAEGNVGGGTGMTLFGNPFRPVRLEPAWLAWQGGLIRRLAVQVYEKRQLPSGQLDLERL